jgi:hypothetical protein
MVPACRQAGSSSSCSCLFNLLSFMLNLFCSIFLGLRKIHRTYIIQTASKAINHNDVKFIIYIFPERYLPKDENSFSQTTKQGGNSS